MAKDLGGKRSFGFHITTHHQRKPEEEQKQGGSWEAGADAEGCCLLVCLTCFLKEPKTISPAVAPLPVGWVLLTQSLIKKMLFWLASLQRYFLNWGVLLTDDSGLCQVGRNPASLLNAFGRAATLKKFYKKNRGKGRKNYQRN